MPIITAAELRPVLGVGSTVSDATLTQICNAAEGAITPYLRVKNAAGTNIDYSTIPVVKECTLAAAVELYKTRTAPGGQYSAVDFTPSPFQLGRSFFERFEGPMASYITTRGWLG
jgi:hypothetical protein